MSDAKLKLFADDTNLFIFGKSFNEISIKTNNLPHKLNKWFVANKLNLNIDKTCYLAFSSNSNDHSLTSLSINEINIKVKVLNTWVYGLMIN